jgi:hypothetical protein
VILISGFILLTQKLANRANRAGHSPKRLAQPRSPILPLSTLTARAALARPLHPAALAFVPSGIVLVRVRVRWALPGVPGPPRGAQHPGHGRRRGPRCAFGQPRGETCVRGLDWASWTGLELELGKKKKKSSKSGGKKSFCYYSSPLIVTYFADRRRISQSIRTLEKIRTKYVPKYVFQKDFFALFAF